MEPTSTPPQRPSPDGQAAWRALFAEQHVAVVTSLQAPPKVPEGFVPMRVGLSEQLAASDAPLPDDPSDALTGFSLDTLLWTDDLLEQRLSALMAWARRPPLTQRQRLDRINWLLHAQPPHPNPSES